jgi:hypothetical protein
MRPLGNTVRRRLRSLLVIIDSSLIVGQLGSDGFRRDLK